MSITSPTLNSSVTNILYADDDPDDHFILKSSLKSIKNINLISFNSGNAMIEYLESHNDALPDIIVLDMSIYCKYDPNCIESIRKNAAYNHIPLIIYSGSTHQSMISELFHKGANLYVHKSDTPDSIREIFKKLLTINWGHHMANPIIENFRL